MPEEGLRELCGEKHLRVEVSQSYWHQEGTLPCSTCTSPFIFEASDL